MLLVESHGFFFPLSWQVCVIFTYFLGLKVGSPTGYSLFQIIEVLTSTLTISGCLKTFCWGILLSLPSHFEGRNNQVLPKIFLFMYETPCFLGISSWDCLFCPIGIISSTPYFEIHQMFFLVLLFPQKVLRIPKFALNLVSLQLNNYKYVYIYICMYVYICGKKDMEKQ